MENNNTKIVTYGARRDTASSTKSVKPVRRSSKRASQPSHSPIQNHAPLSAHDSDKGRHKRARKACERCRQKKTKCDGEFPCKRCKDDGLVCIVGRRKFTEYKQLSTGYAEVLESTQLALIDTIHRLYTMVRSGQKWVLAEPELNERGQPVVHDIATLLGSVRPNTDADLPLYTAFPEDVAGLSRLAAEMEVHQQKHYKILPTTIETYTKSTCDQTERSGSSELDCPNSEQDYWRTTMDNPNYLQKFNPDSNLDMSATSNEADPIGLFSVQPPPKSASYTSWNVGKPTFMSGAPQLRQQVDMDMADLMFSQGLVEPEFGTVETNVLSCPKLEGMVGFADPMIY